MGRIKKVDILIALLIGEAAGLLLLAIVKNIAQDMPRVLLVPFWVWPVVFPVFCLIWFLFVAVLSAKIKAFLQIGKFVLVGGLNFLIDLGILNLLIFLTSIVSGQFYAVFKGISFVIAVGNSYLLNKFWTFKNPVLENARQAPKKKVGKEFLQFFIVSLIGFIANVSIASLVVNWIGPQWGVPEKVWASVGAVIAAFFGMAWNFVGYKFIVFKK